MVHLLDDHTRAMLQLERHWGGDPAFVPAMSGGAAVADALEDDFVARFPTPEGYNLDVRERGGPTKAQRKHTQIRATLPRPGPHEVGAGGSLK